MVAAHIPGQAVQLEQELQVKVIMVQQQPRVLVEVVVQAAPLQLLLVATLVVLVEYDYNTVSVEQQHSMQAVVVLVATQHIVAEQELQLLLVQEAMVVVAQAVKVAAVQFYTLVRQTFEVAYKQLLGNQILAAVAAVADHQCWLQTAAVV